MFKNNSIKAILAGMAVCLVTLAYSQPKSAGATFSYTGLGLCYEHDFSEHDSFMEIQLKTELPEYLEGRKGYPGISASVVWNIIIKEWKSSEGNTLRFFAGPGAIAGYGADFKKPDGVFYGLKGRVGGECLFSRNVQISVSLSPIVGSHIHRHGEHFSMKHYRNGVIYGLVPEIGIKYSF